MAASLFKFTEILRIFYLKRPFTQHKYSNINDCFMIHVEIVLIHALINQFRLPTKMHTIQPYVPVIHIFVVALFSRATRITPKPQHSKSNWITITTVANLLHDVTINSTTICLWIYKIYTLWENRLLQTNNKIGAVFQNV